MEQLVLWVMLVSIVQVCWALQAAISQEAEPINLQINCSKMAESTTGLCNFNGKVMQPSFERAAALVARPQVGFDLDTISGPDDEAYRRNNDDDSDAFDYLTKGLINIGA